MPVLLGVNKKRTFLSTIQYKSRQKECFVQTDNTFYAPQWTLHMNEWGNLFSLHSRESRKGTALNIWCVDSKNKKEVVGLFWSTNSMSKKYPASALKNAFQSKAYDLSDKEENGFHVKRSKMMHKKSVVWIHELVEWSLFRNIKQEYLLNSDQSIYYKILHIVEEK